MEDNRMKIAVTYEDGNIFQHFGKSKEFKVYDIENQEIISSQIESTNGQGPVSYTHLDVYKRQDP